LSAMASALGATDREENAARWKDDWPAGIMKPRTPEEHSNNDAMTTLIVNLVRKKWKMRKTRSCVRLNMTVLVQYWH
jgi:hypothetical protein